MITETMFMNDTEDVGYYIPFVSMAVYSYYIKAIGILSAALTVFFYAASQGFAVGSNVWLSVWSDDKNSTIPSVRNKYLGVYGGLGVFQAITVVIGFIIVARSAIIGSKLLHNNMLERIFRCPNFYFDMTPIGRIVNRFSKDVDVVDMLLPMNLRSLIMCFVSVILFISVLQSFLSISSQMYNDASWQYIAIHNRLQ
ncbi:Canalicular multispecific organic anion transporter 1 [Armadillidium nasatum]|uniref:Canalicular multispecific organic anion transporter 1 n=1 Tax=Armadillidium nasatum TaxID=96803 RepID=A0A5N5TKF4_9CRUS|nr:Canalicular multispecific organic anion transporter 1 [Armadillidium nasatum]